LKRTSMLVTEQASEKNRDPELTMICHSGKEFTYSRITRKSTLNTWVTFCGIEG